MTAADVNGDGKPDVVVVTEDAVIWYENPGWRKQDIIRGATVRDNVCIQPHDIDGDGRIDFALGAGWKPTDTKGASTLQWLGRDREGRWQVHPIAFEEPTLHRLRFGDVKGSGRKQLVVAALQGAEPRDQTGGKGRGFAYSFMTFPPRPAKTAWPARNRPTRRCIRSTISSSWTSTAMGATRSCWPRGKACSCSTAIRQDSGPRRKSAPATRRPIRSKGRAK